MSQLGFYFDATRCTGCHTCALACKDYKDLPEQYAFRNVFEYVGGAWTSAGQGSWTTDAYAYYISSACNHCDNPACAAACPVDAYVKDEETGVVLSADKDLCIGCGSCVQACPYEAPVLDTRARKAIKCDLCFDRMQEGGRPVCQEACPMRAIQVGEIDELRAQYGDLAAVAPLPDPATTGPNFVMSEPRGAQKVGSDNGAIANVREIA